MGHLSRWRTGVTSDHRRSAGARRGVRLDSPCSSPQPRCPCGGAPSADLYTSKMENSVWQPSKRYENKLLDSIGFKCRLNAVARDGLVLGVVSVHDFGKFHKMV